MKVGQGPREIPTCSPPGPTGLQPGRSRREEIASGPADRHAKSSIITTLCSRPVYLRSILKLGAGREGRQWPLGIDRPRDRYLGCIWSIKQHEYADEANSSGSQSLEQDPPTTRACTRYCVSRVVCNPVWFPGLMSFNVGVGRRRDGASAVPTEI